MSIVGLELQRAGVGFISVSATHRQDGSVRVDDLAALTPEDLSAFEVWAAENDVEVGSAHVADTASIRAYAERSQEW